MRNPGALALFVVPALVASTPAWCCTRTLTMEDFFMPGIVPGRELLLPTNVQLLMNSFGTRAELVDAAGDRVTINLDDNPLLKLDLLPNSAYTLESDSLFEPFSFTTAAGPDTEPPPAPETTVVAGWHAPVWSLGDTCTSDRPAHNRYTIHSEDEENILAIVGSGGLVDSAGVGSVSIRDYDGTAVNSPVRVVAIDLAGNRSPEIEVDLNDAQGGCAQASPASLSPLLALSVLLWRRRRGRSRGAMLALFGAVVVAGASGCQLQPAAAFLSLCVEQEGADGADVEVSPPVVSFVGARVVPADDHRLGTRGSLCGDAVERVELEVADEADRRAWFAVSIADGDGRSAPGVDFGVLLTDNAVVDVEVNFQVGFPDFGAVTVSDAAGPVFVAEQTQPVEPHTRGGVEVSLGETEGLKLPTACGDDQHHALRVETTRVVEILHGDSAVVDAGEEQMEVHNVRTVVNTPNGRGCSPDAGSPSQVNWYAARR